MQLITPLIYIIFIRPLKEIIYELLPGIIFKVIKPLYKVLEVNIY